MLQRLRARLEHGPFETQLLEIGASTQLVLKVAILEADEVGIVCRVKGMLGWGDVQGRPWSRVAWINLPGSAE
jgi:hypothetical protein